MEQNVPLVTVVIPCYNQGQYLAEAIQGARDQTHPRVEIIVVDDGSTDTTAVVACAYPGVRYVHQENRGQGAARNRGLQEGTGEYVVFLDSDDRLHPDAVQIGLRELGQSPGAAFAYGRCNLIDADGTWLATSERPVIQGDHYRALLSGNFLPNPAAIMFRRDILEAVDGFDVSSKVKGAEDYELCLRLARDHGARGYKDVVADYRLRLGNWGRLTLDAAFNYARWLTRNEADAEDVVQDAYVRALRFYASLRGDNARAWLLTIVRHTWYGRFRPRDGVHQTTVFDEMNNERTAEGLDPEALLLQRQTVDEVRAALEELPVDFREVIVLRELEGLSYKEIAGVAGIPIGTVMSRLARGRERLLTILKSATSPGRPS